MHTAGKGGQVDQSLMDTIGFVVQNRLEMHQHQFREKEASQRTQRTRTYQMIVCSCRDWVATS